MTRNKGVLLFARNNSQIDYVKQAVFLAKRITSYIGVPVSLVTDSIDYLKDNFEYTVFDEIIPIEYFTETNRRLYYDGSISHKLAPFKNKMRSRAYELSPYYETIVMDTDYIVSSNFLSKCFGSTNDLMLFKDSEDIAKVRNEKEFQIISETSIDFYWATVIYFKKTESNKIFFDLVDHIQENWDHYNKAYHLKNATFRNDFAFSIAIHIMNGFAQGNIVTEMPSKHFYTTDKDILYSLTGDKMLFLVEKKNYLGEYTPITTSGIDVHVMNKFSLERVINNAH